MNSEKLHRSKKQAEKQVPTPFLHPVPVIAHAGPAGQGQGLKKLIFRIL